VDQPDRLWSKSKQAFIHTQAIPRLPHATVNPKICRTANMNDSNPSSSGDNGKDDTPHNDASSGNLHSEPAGMQVTSDEINFLVYRYLQEAGMYSFFYSDSD